MKSFVKPPVEDKLTNNGFLSDAWKEWFIDTWQSMDERSSEAGTRFARLTTLQRDSDEYINQTALSNGDLDGLTIYNTDTDKLQTWTAASGVWNDLF